MDEKDQKKQEELDDFANRWSKAVDNFRYLDVEHRHKEKEYGVSWRTEFKFELTQEHDAIVNHKGGNPFDQPGSNFKGTKFDVIALIVEKDYADSLRFYNNGQLEMLQMMNDTLVIYEKAF